MGKAWGQSQNLPEFELLSALYVLDAVKGFGPNKYKALFEGNVDPRRLVNEPDLMPFKGVTRGKLVEALRAVSEKERAKAADRAARQVETAQRLGASVLTYGHSSYPPAVYVSNNPVPVLYVQRGTGLLPSLRSVACVGSRAIAPPYARLHARFAAAACHAGLGIVSGFALGADTIGHRVAHDEGAPTICVMPCGLDRPFPPENRSLWQSFLEYENAVLVSEFPFGMSASSLTLRKRNKLIVAFAESVLVSQSSASGGAMNAYRFAREQKKPVATFASDDERDATSGNSQIASELLPGDAVFSLGATDAEFAAWLARD